MGQCISSEEEKNIAPGNVEESDSGNKNIKLSKKVYAALDFFTILKIRFWWSM